MGIGPMSKAMMSIKMTKVPEVTLMNIIVVDDVKMVGQLIKFHV
jgi:hypothetical protein